MEKNRYLVALIYAHDENNVLGKNGGIPWHSPHDFKWFKTITLGHAVVMGRKTWESLPVKPLPGRKNYVVSRNPHYEAPGATVVTDLATALTSIAAQDHCTAFVIGGKGLLEEAAAYASVAYVSKIGVKTTVEESCVMAPQLPPYIVEETVTLSEGNAHPSAVVERRRLR